MKATEAEKERKATYRATHKEETRQRDAKYRATHADEIRRRKKEYYEAHKAERSAYNAEWRIANRESLLEKKRAYYAAHRNELIAAAATRAKSHPERCRASEQKSCLRYPEKLRARRLVQYQVSAGRFPPANTMVCDICQEALAAHWHHHNGYGPGHEIDVIAVCTQCHPIADKQAKEPEAAQ